MSSKKVNSLNDKLSESETFERYRKLMGEANERVAFIKSCILEDKQATKHQLEIISLNIRKILELIALSSLVANEKLLEETRKEITRLWNAKQILKIIERKNSNFYIDPIRKVEEKGSVPRVHKFEGIHSNAYLKENFLSKKEFEKIYDKCSSLIHATNPFRTIDLDYYRTNMPVWIKKIELSLELFIINLTNGVAYIVEIDTPNGVRIIKAMANK